MESKVKSITGWHCGYDHIYVLSETLMYMCYSIYGDIVGMITLMYLRH